ncbi:MAG TPA: DUF4271 domain-containing protein [Cytophagaceae bacterium]
MRDNLRYIFFFVGVFFSLSASANWEKDTLNNAIVRTLDNDWLVFSRKYEAYVPYTTTVNDKITSITQKVDLKKYKNYNLNFIAAPELALFINQKLVFKNTTKQVKYIQIKISDIINEEIVHKELITFYNESQKLPYQNVFIGFEKPVIKKASGNNIFILKREISERDLYIICYLIILSLLAILKTRYPRRFSQFFSLNYMLPNNASDDLVIKSVSTPGLLFILINSFAVALIYLLTNHFLTDSNLQSSALTFGYFFKLALMVILFFTAKFIFMKLIGWIYNIEEIVKIQFFELIKVLLNFNILIVSLLIVSLSFPFFEHKFASSIFIYLIFFVFLIVVLRNSLLIFKLSGFRNLYLFSYLCTTEILPFVIMIKIFTN